MTRRNPWGRHSCLPAPPSRQEYLPAQWRRNCGTAQRTEETGSQEDQPVGFRAVFIAIVVGAALIVAAFLVNSYRPRAVTDKFSAALVRASGTCAECHAEMQFSVVHEYDLSVHAEKKINCLECHQPATGQESKDHHGFVIAARLTAGELPHVSRADLSAIPTQPPCRAVLGGGLRRQGPQRRTSGLQRKIPPRILQTAAQRARRPGRAGGVRRWLRPVSQRRPAQRRRHHRHLHRLSHAPHVFRRDRPPADDLRPVPHGAGPFPAGNLRRVQTRRPVPGPTLSS